MTDAGILARVEAVLTTAKIDCTCRTRLQDALMRFAALEARRQARRDLADARHQRDLVAGLVGLLADLDEIASDEPDASVYGELAHLFDDVAQAATSGAAALRRLG
jgi:hypothetical protein